MARLGAVAARERAGYLRRQRALGQGAGLRHAQARRVQPVAAAAAEPARGHPAHTTHRACRRPGASGRWPGQLAVHHARHRRAVAVGAGHQRDRFRQGPGRLARRDPQGGSDAAGGSAGQAVPFADVAGADFAPQAPADGAPAAGSPTSPPAPPRERRPASPRRATMCSAGRSRASTRTCRSRARARSAACWPCRMRASRSRCRRI